MDDDPLRPARGVLAGLGWSLALYAAIIIGWMML
jgi:hypothetical protein